MPRQPPIAKSNSRPAKDPRRLYSWTKTSKDYRKYYPYCQCCIHRDTKTAETYKDLSVHHIEMMKNAPHKLLDWDNLLTLCRRCHKYFDELEKEDENQAYIEGREIKESRDWSKYYD